MAVYLSNKGASVPGIVKYQGVKDLLVTAIEEGRFPPGSQLPSEPRLAEMFHVSRGTIREALRMLEQEAVISRRSGVGTMVLRPAKTERITSFTDQVRRAGMAPTTRVLDASCIMASEAGGRVAEAYGLDPDQAAVTPVYRVDRLRLGDDRPLARQVICLLAAEFDADLLEATDFTSSLFRLYARYHRQPAWADEIIQARFATPDEAEILGLADSPPEGRLVYVRERITHDAQNRPLEVLTSIDRGDFFTSYRYRLLEDTRG
jgi:GntR family transcriptional regulator